MGQQYFFGTGHLFLVGETANATPRRVGTLQEVSVDVSFNKKELFGTNKFPVSVAQGTAKIECKAKFAELYGGMLAELFFGVTPVANQKALTVDEAGTIPAPSGPYTITVANSATFLTDLGVRNATTGLALKKVASAPATGQYSVSAGVYTFAAADTGISVVISYSYTKTGTGSVLTVTNQPLGNAVYFGAFLGGTYDSNNLYMKFFRCIGTKLSMPTKMEDFTIQEFDFSPFADASNNVLEIGYASE